MEVILDKRYPLAVDVARAWAVLGDVRAVAGCMPGASITEQVDATHFKGTVKSKVGPATMQFSGDIEVLEMDAGRHAIEMLGKGADRGGSSASMKLAAYLEPGTGTADSVLVGRATVTVSGKLAQFGSRLLVPVSDAMLAQFADNFVAAASALPSSSSAAAIDATAGADSDADSATAPGAAPVEKAAAPAKTTELNALGLAWTVFKRWLADLFGKRA